LDFSLYKSEPPFNDVIFQDATQKLQVVPPEERHYHQYLGPEFLRARQLVDCRAGGVSVRPAVSSLVVSFLLLTIIRL
jgi:melanoma-associated antigen p97